jgi:hypothetical protein
MMFWRYIFSGPFDGPEHEPQPFFGEPVIVIFEAVKPAPQSLACPSGISHETLAAR